MLAATCSLTLQLKIYSVAVCSERSSDGSAVTTEEFQRLEQGSSCKHLLTSALDRSDLLHHRKIALGDPCLPSFLGTNFLFQTLQSGRLKPTFPQFSNLVRVTTRIHLQLSEERKHERQDREGRRDRFVGETQEKTQNSHQGHQETSFPHNSWQLSSLCAPLTPSDRLCHQERCQWICPPSIL